ncbi:MAG: ABC transporter permease [Chryseotalea sp. WA131a]|nr:MAG: ABC transporter permease [Chryseotalea sp. WA131a]
MISPPKIFIRFFRWYCHPKLLDHIEGDLIEVYQQRLNKVGKRKADVKFVIDVLLLFRPSIIKPMEGYKNLNNYGMIKSYLKIGWRNLLKQKAYSFINISGLAVGLACSIFTLLWVIDEFAYDAFHKDGERIFTFRTNSSYTDGMFTFPNTSGRLAEGIKEFPEVEESARFTFRSRLLIHYKNKSFFEDGAYADASFFKIFTISLVEGNPINPLPDVSSVVISEKLARKYFNGESALGKTIRVNNETDLQVTAVFRDLPTQSTIQFQVLLPYSIYAKSDPYNQEWGAWTGGDTYVKLKSGTDKSVMDEKISKLITHPKIWPRWGNNVELFLFPLKEWHLHSNFENGKQSGGRIAYIKGFGLITSFILLIACVNFMNLATARSINRAKEIGVRKVIGAARQSLVGQFLSESIFISFIALFGALVIVYLLLPYFNLLTDKKIAIDYANPILIPSFIAVTLLTGLIAGSYPAFFLSSHKAIQILKDRLSGSGGAGVRKALVVFQFSLSVIMIICALVVYRQIEYMREKNLGFDKENVFYLNANGKVGKNYEAFKQAITGHAGISSVSRAADEPMNIQNGLEMGDDGWRGKTKEDNVGFQWLFCDVDFLSAFKFDLIEGRDFSLEIDSDTTNFIINEEAARRMHLTHPVGEMLKVDRKGMIIGVVKDFHSKGLDQAIQPVIISMRPENSNRIFIHYKKHHLQEVMSHVAASYKKLEPDFPMEYTFLDDSFNQQYKNELLIGKFSTAFMSIAVFISCLGLFGLASFTAERRTKEICIRKVLGASVSQLTALLCKDFVVLVCISILIGFPIAWLAATKFLESYPFRTDINISIFAITGFSLLSIALATVAYQSIKAALSNPVNSLKSE